MSNVTLANQSVQQQTLQQQTGSSTSAGQTPASCVVAPAQVTTGTVPNGMFPNIGMIDYTTALPGFGQGALQPSEVVFHRTGDNSADGTLDTYAQRVSDGSNRGAHYLIDKSGPIYLTAPTNKKMSHVENRNQGLGIELAGAPTSVDMNLSAANVRTKVEGLNLSPKMKARLLSKSDADLKQALKDSDHGLIYEDITPEQKRATWNLSQKLIQKHGFSGGDFHAHEQLQAKTLGEGENTLEFFETMNAYPDKIEQLKSRLNDLKAAGPAGDPDAHKVKVEHLESVLQREETTQNALTLDGKPEEDAGVLGEECLGVPADYTHREQLRKDFYDNFYARQKELDDLL